VREGLGKKKKGRAGAKTSKAQNNGRRRKIGGGRGPGDEVRRFDVQTEREPKIRHRRRSSFRGTKPVMREKPSEAVTKKIPSGKKEGTR